MDIDEPGREQEQGREHTLALGRHRGVWLALCELVMFNFDALVNDNHLSPQERSELSRDVAESLAYIDSVYCSLHSRVIELGSQAGGRTREEIRREELVRRCELLMARITMAMPPEVEEYERAMAAERRERLPEEIGQLIKDLADGIIPQRPEGGPGPGRAN